MVNRDREECKRNDYNNMHKNIKTLTTRRKTNTLSESLLDVVGKIVSDKVQLLDKWKSYVKQLFHD